jgi:hypothetical protein
MIELLFLSQASQRPSSHVFDVAYHASFAWRGNPTYEINQQV